MNKIIVHGGQAHLDEVVAASLVLINTAKAEKVSIATIATDTTICRRDPTAEEIEDPTVWVLDVGGIHAPEKKDFDHHGLARGTKECAYTLLARGLGLEEQLHKLLPWFYTRAAVDSIGPFATAKEAGMEWSGVEKFLGPLEGLWLRGFMAAADDERAAVWVRPLAEMIQRKLDCFVRVKALLAERKVSGVEVYDFCAADPQEAEEVSDALVGDRGVAVFHDNRGEGFTLLRLNDDPRIDFSHLEGAEGVLFAHKGGFILKTTDKRVNVDALISAASK